MICRRFTHAIQDGSVDPSTFEELVEITVINEGDGKLRLKEDLSNAEIDQCLALMEASADQAGIPDEVEEIDLGSLIEQDLNSVLTDNGLEPLSAE